ncbi:hypothetical protein [Iningainema tapete]|uniref:Uncharacterized protein n=1 Tax=Iningainema tapete BLCC-T55 TaxID=2748662 RepID=A0A8J7C7K8_9CYAN|nr:hypothetical protein [Iningainema tapete]MBD2773326.1 hypothetical protein [Iningainema tapete BLCC-T55]
MFNVANLTTKGRYLIEGERGEWHYSGCTGSKYNFWRKAVGSTRRVNLTLSAIQVKRRLWQEVQTLNLGNLEAFRGE